MQALAETSSQETVVDRPSSSRDVRSREPSGIRCRTCGEVLPREYRVCPRDATPLTEAAAADDPLLGTIIAGTYCLTRMLASGGMGRLYEAEHTRLERRFAVKVIHEQYAHHPDTVARFEREARAASRVSCDHVVDVIDILRTPDGRPCIVSELLDGEDLQSMLDRVGKIPYVHAIRIGQQMCRGLGAAHDCGVVHRDLKPSNVFLAARADGRITLKILDFGVAKLAGDSSITKTGAVVGTPAYMAPEQARGASLVDERADVYAVGAVLYRMLTGQAPHGGGDPAVTLTRLLQDEPQRPRALDASIPEALEAVIQRAMARDPAERLPSVEALECELASLDERPSPVEVPAPANAVAQTGEAERDGTRVLPGGSVPDTRKLAHRARRARPFALFVGSLLAAATASVYAAVLGGLLAALGFGPLLTTGERTLVGTGAVAVAIAVVVTYSRLLKVRWPSAPAVEALARRHARALLAGATVLGVLELGARASYAVAGEPIRASSAFAITMRIVIAAVVAFIMALVPRRSNATGTGPRSSPHK